MSKPQTIFRNASTSKQFTSVLNSCLQDGTLSPEAGWVLMLVLSLPTDWAVNLEWIAKRRRLGRDRARAAVAELIEHQYCRRRQLRGGTGNFGAFVFEFTDLPGSFGGGAGSPAPEDQAPVRKPENKGLAPAPEDQAPARKPENKGSAPAPERPAPVDQAPYKGQSTQRGGLPPVAYEAEAGDLLIPFDHVCFGSTDKLEDTGTRRWQKHRAIEPALPWPWPPFSPEVIAKIRRLCLDPAPLVERYHQKTKGQKIKRPNAYLMTMAQEAVAERDGTTRADVVAVTSHGKVGRAEAIVREAQLDERRQARGAGVATPNGSALAAALKRLGDNRKRGLQ